MREQFNLENFLAGKYERVETRSGRKVDDLAYFPKSKPYKVAGTIDDEDEGIDTWLANGFFHKFKKQTDHDLFGILKDEKG